MVVDVPEIFFQNYIEGDSITCACEHPIGALIKYANSPAVYYWDGFNKRAFQSESAFEDNYFYWNYVLNISDINQYPTGNTIINKELNLILSW